VTATQRSHRSSSKSTRKKGDELEKGFEVRIACHSPHFAKISEIKSIADYYRQNEGTFVLYRKQVQQEVQKFSSLEKEIIF
jgi:hypothetical protein